MRRHLAFLALAASLVAVSGAHAANIVIVNQDGPGEGFNDPTPVAPVGGNPATTIGGQRLFVFQHAANIWGNLLPSTVQIRIQAQFNPQTCNETSGVLGSAGPVTVHRDFANAPFPATWYHQALANRLAGVDLSASNDINITFNSSIGQPACLPQGWYLGIDGNEGTAIELLPVVLHEMGHGLGFSTTTNGQTGLYFNSFPSAYDHFLLDLDQNLRWNQMTEAQRVASGVNCQRLVWDGPNTTSAAPSKLGAKPILRVNAPAAVAGDYEVGQASFGPPLTQAGVTGPVVLVNDGVGVPTNGCEPFLNAMDVNGKIALIDRGGCTFVTKVQNAMAAGAIAVIVADSTAGCPPAGLGGSDPTITIPAVRVTQPDGVQLKTGLLQGLNATLRVDPALKAGMKGGRVMVYSPVPYAPGSSISHWDVSAQPNLLMEPAINTDLHNDVDLALHHFADIGWLNIPVSALAAAGRVVARPNEVRIDWYASSSESRVWLAERRQATGGWLPLGAPESLGDGTLVLRDGAVMAGERYAYRLGTPGEDGELLYTDEVWVDVPLEQLALALEGARPNPSGRQLTVGFTLATEAPARLEVVDVAGRIVHAAEVGAKGAGRHVVRLGHENSFRPGVYFIRLSQAGQTLTSPVVVR